MTATVHFLSDHRGVFIFPEGAGFTAYMATRGQPPRIAHKQWFESLEGAERHALALADRWECTVSNYAGRTAGGEDANNG